MFRPTPMKWSVRLGRFAGIDVYLHVTFLLFLAFIAFLSAKVQRSWLGAVDAAGFFLSVFGCVLLHEFGHALMARRYGVATRDITLLPIGGVARLERMPDKPVQEFWVALAGPAVNVVIALGLLGVLVFRGLLVPERLLSVTQGGLLERLLAVNILLVLFNLLPAFPMDGGRVLRALLAMRMEYTRATQIAATLGQGMALLFAAIGLFVYFNPILIFIAFFVWIGASQETTAAQVRSSLGGARVRDAMLTQFTATTLDEPLEHALARLRSAGESPLMPVLHEGRLVGLLTPENVSEFVLIRSALRRAEAVPAVPPVLRPG